MPIRPSATMPFMRRLRAALPAALLALAAAATAAPALAGPGFVSDPAGGGQPIDNMQPSLGLNYFMPLSGIFPSENRNGGGYLGQIRMFAGTFTPGVEIGYAVAPEGQVLTIDQHQALFSLLGVTYGGDGVDTFALPDLTGRASVQHGQGPGLSNWNLGQTRGSATTTLTTSQLPVHTHTFAHADSPTGPAGSGQPVSNFQPTLASTFWIATQGVFPSQSRSRGGGGEPFLGQVMQFAGNFAPPGFAEANGQILSINQNQALFSLLGATYGGDGETTFALPDLRGRVPVHPGQANGTGNTWSLGERSGVESNTLGINNMPSHSHGLPALGIDSHNTGNSQPLDNTQPGLGINFIISLIGVFPTDDHSLPEFAQIIGEVSMFAGNFAPRGYAFLDGQELSIAEHTALFAIIGWTYGGDGETTFALPDLRGRTPIHADGSLVQLGEQLGIEHLVLTEANLPEHDHTYVPEPTSAALLGFAGVFLLRRRRAA